MGGIYERVTKPSGTIEHKHSILAGGETVAIRTLRSNGTNDTRYLQKDHLGSVDALTNEAGSVVAKLSYDTFGKRRSPITWTGSPSAGDWTAIAGVTHRGYTEHEQIDNVDLIHMNGRVYDPVIGRFTSADPTVQAAFHSQSLNRYSYVGNNPLSSRDPTGFTCFEDTPDGIVPCYYENDINFDYDLYPWDNGDDWDGLDPGGGLGPHFPGGTPSGNPGTVPETTTSGLCTCYVPAGPVKEFAPPAAPPPVIQPPTPPPPTVTPPTVTPPIAPGSAQAGGGAIDLRQAALIGAGVAASFIPGVGEAMDAAILADPRSAWWERALAGASLTINVATGGILPNAAGITLIARTMADVGTSIGAKVGKQLARRGWSQDDVVDAIKNPMRTVITRDTRHVGRGGRMNEPATAYYSRNGGYVVRNDRTGDVVQVSNRNNPNWSAPWD